METPNCPTQTRLYADGKLIADGFGVAEVPDRLREHPEAVLWLDLEDPEIGDLTALQEYFGLHPLAVEDAVHDHQRPKIDRYPGHLFLNVYDVRLRTEPDLALHTAEISSFVTPRALITVRKSAGDTARYAARFDSDAELGAGSGVGFLVWGLLDVVVDGQHEAARRLDEAIDAAEDQLLEEGGAPRSIRLYGFALRRTLAELRRPVSPMPDLIGVLIRPDAKVVTESLAPYFRDVDDHAQRATGMIDNSRERIGGLLDLDLNEQSNQLNIVTRKLAAWAAIITVPTALTGFFGQNVPYWGYETRTGFIVSTALIVITATGLYAYLKRKGWL